MSLLWLPRTEFVLNEVEIFFARELVKAGLMLTASQRMPELIIAQTMGLSAIHKYPVVTACDFLKAEADRVEELVHEAALRLLLRRVTTQPHGVTVLEVAY